MAVVMLWRVVGFEVQSGHWWSLGSRGGHCCIYTRRESLSISSQRRSTPPRSGSATPGPRITCQGSCAAFRDLDTIMCGMIHFRDDSVVLIKGSSSVLFMCKNGEHHMFTGVYYIPRLTMNIISVGQLNETGYDIRIKEGVMSLREPSGCLLA
jgi:hypothetical protein